jgi:Fe2+ transport system protein A
MQKNTILSKLKLDTYAKIIDITCNSTDRRRFLDLGLIKGTTIKPIFRSPLGDPTAYEVRKSIIALREEDASKIKVRKIF